MLTAPVNRAQRADVCCNRPSTALTHAATNHASATVRRRCVSVCTSAAHHNSATLAQAQLSKYGNTVELGPLVNGFSHGKTSSASVTTGASKAGLDRGIGWDGAFTGADYRGVRQTDGRHLTKLTEMQKYAVRYPLEPRIYTPPPQPAPNRPTGPL